MEEDIEFYQNANLTDNSKMFSHWYSTKGRIGRVEYGLTMVFALLLYAILLIIGGRLGDALNIDIASSYYLWLHVLSMIIPFSIMVLAAVKRVHDAGKSIEKVVGPCIAIIGLTLFKGGKFVPMFIAIFLCLFFAIFYKSQEGVNEYGPQPRK